MPGASRSFDETQQPQVNLPAPGQTGVEVLTALTQAVAQGAKASARFLLDTGAYSDNPFVKTQRADIESALTASGRPFTAQDVNDILAERLVRSQDILGRFLPTTTSPPIGAPPQPQPATTGGPFADLPDEGKSKLLAFMHGAVQSGETPEAVGEFLTKNAQAIRSSLVGEAPLGLRAVGGVGELAGTLTEPTVTNLVAIPASFATAPAAEAFAARHLAAEGIKRLVVRFASGGPAIEYAASEATKAGLQELYGATARITAEPGFLRSLAKSVGAALPFSAGSAIEAAQDPDGRSPAGAFAWTTGFFVGLDVAGHAAVGPAWRGFQRLINVRVRDSLLERLVAREAERAPAKAFADAAARAAVEEVAALRPKPPPPPPNLEPQPRLGLPETSRAVPRGRGGGIYAGPDTMGLIGLPDTARPATAAAPYLGNVEIAPGPRGTGVRAPDYSDPMGLLGPATKEAVESLPPEVREPLRAVTERAAASGAIDPTNPIHATLTEAVLGRSPETALEAVADESATSQALPAASDAGTALIREAQAAPSAAAPSRFKSALVGVLRSGKSDESQLTAVLGPQTARSVMEVTKGDFGVRPGILRTAERDAQLGADLPASAPSLALTGREVTNPDHAAPMFVAQQEYALGKGRDLTVRLHVATVTRDGRLMGVTTGTEKELAARGFTIGDRPVDLADKPAADWQRAYQISLGERTVLSRVNAPLAAIEAKLPPDFREALGQISTKDTREAMRRTGRTATETPATSAAAIRERAGAARPATSVEALAEKGVELGAESPDFARRVVEAASLDPASAIERTAAQPPSLPRPLADTLADLTSARSADARQNAILGFMDSAQTRAGSRGMHVTFADAVDAEGKPSFAADLTLPSGEVRRYLPHEFDRLAGAIEGGQAVAPKAAGDPLKVPKGHC